jgi:ABC-type glycerol-3-phosphate transport system permease component
MENTLILKKDKFNNRFIRTKVIKKISVYFLLIFFALIALLPLYYLIITAFKSLIEASTKATMWPNSFELFKNISFVINHPDYNVVRMFLNTTFIFILKVTGTSITCALAGYGFAMYKFPKKNLIFFILLATMMIPGELLNIPIYEFFVNAGLKEVAYLPLWITTWFATDVFMIFLFRQFFLRLPKDIIEAARLDGCSEFKAFFKIVIPMNRSIFTTVFILYFVGTYNDLYGPALYISSKENWVMANSITIFENLYRSGSGSYVVPWNYVSVASLIAMIPEIIIFAVLQKQFMASVSGVEVKG